MSTVTAPSLALEARFAANLAEAERTGLLRSVDAALANFLMRLDKAHALSPAIISNDAPAALFSANDMVKNEAINTLVYWLAALTSEQHGQGHLHLDIPLFLQMPERLGWTTPLAESLLCSWRVLTWPVIRMHLVASSLVAEICADTHDDESSTKLAGASATTPLVLEADCLYLRRAWRDEVAVASALRRRMQTAPALADTVDLRPMLDQLFPESSTHLGLNWQKVACALAVRQGLTIITGGPGTGKTTTVVKLLGLLQGLAIAHQGHALRIALAAPTGLAAARLNSAIARSVAALPLAEEVRACIPSQVTTIHRLLGPIAESRRFRHHENQRLLLDVLVIDEASMLDLELMAAVLRALPDHARLILLGDKDQLASVEAGAIMGDLCGQAEIANYEPSLAQWLSQQSGEALLPAINGAGLSPATTVQNQAINRHVVMLRHSHRFDPTRGIGRLAQAVRDGTAATLADFTEFAPEVSVKPRAQLFEGYDAYWQCVQQPPALNIIAAAKAVDDVAWQHWARAALDAFDQFRILAAVREGDNGVSGLNEACERYFKIRQGRELPAMWYVGRPVMVTRNDYALGLMNGDVGITLWWPDEQAENGQRLRVVFRDTENPQGPLRWLLPSRLATVETVFAMTVHKAQGSEFTCAALVLPTHQVPVLTRELIYTAVTRARDEFVLCQLESTLWRQAVTRQALRSSGLGLRLGHGP